MEVERERTRQVARIGSNVIAHLVAIERARARLRVRGAGDAD